MIIFLIFLGLLYIIFLLLYLSTLEIEIQKFKFNSKNKTNKKVEDYLFYIRLKLLNKFTWIKIKIDNKKINKWTNSKMSKLKFFSKISDISSIKRILIKNRKKFLKIKNLNYIKELNIKLSKLNLYFEICTKNPVTTAYSVAGISSLISIILAKNVNPYCSNKFNYKIIPKYDLNPRLKLHLNSIISIKIVHIINVIYMLKRKLGKSKIKDSDNSTCKIAS